MKWGSLRWCSHYCTSSGRSSSVFLVGNLTPRPLIECEGCSSRTRSTSFNKIIHKSHKWKLVLGREWERLQGLPDSKWTTDCWKQASALVPTWRDFADGLLIESESDFGTMFFQNWPASYQPFQRPHFWINSFSAFILEYRFSLISIFYLFYHAGNCDRCNVLRSSFDSIYFNMLSPPEWHLIACLRIRSTEWTFPVLLVLRSFRKVVALILTVG